MAIEQNNRAEAAAPGESARGRRRRAALLEALSELLEEAPLAEIQVEDIAARAGLTRSGFYFYFPTKAAAVAALMDDVLERMLTVAADWYTRDDDDHTDRVRQGITAVVTFWRAEAGMINAMFDAAASDGDARTIWDSLLSRLKARVADRIERDRALGLAPNGLPAADLAAVLVDMTAYAMDRDVRAITAGAGPLGHSAETLVHVWDTSLYSG
jgi:AcrR family transcriptional regulator